MAQAFISTYKNHYRGHYQPKSAPCDPTKLTKLEAEGDIWMVDLNKELEEELKNLPNIEKAIKEFYLRRMRTTYQISYCENLLKSSKSTQDLNRRLKSGKINVEENENDDVEFSSELLEYCNKLYGRKTQKIIPPLDTARNVFGYIRPTRLLIPLTVYQNEYGRIGYNVLKRNLSK